MMKTKDRKKGISLIVLIITIIVVIILAAVVILTLSKNNPIESAKEARLKEDVRTFQDELAMTVSKEYTIAGGHRDKKITTSNFDEIKELIPSFSEKYRDKFVIEDDELRYTNKLDEKEKEYAQNLNVKERRVLPKEYQQVEYIESTGTQYINLLLVANSELGFEIECEAKMSNHYQRYRHILGSRKAAGINDYTIMIDSNNYTFRFEYGGITGNNVLLPQVGALQKNHIRFINNTLAINSIDYGSVPFSLFEDNSSSLYMYTMSTNNSPEIRNLQLKLYCLKFYTNEELIRNYIPCYSTTTVINAEGSSVPSNTKGLYDTVEGKFYTNQGAGEDFIAGPDVD